MKFKEISKFPTIKKDIAILVSKEMTSKDVETLIKKKAGKLLLDIKVFDVYEGKNIDEDKRSIAYSLTFGTPDRTLNDDEINSILEGIIKDLLYVKNEVLKRNIPFLYQAVPTTTRPKRPNEEDGKDYIFITGI